MDSDRPRRSESYKVFSAKHRLEDVLNQLKLNVHNIYFEDEKITTNFDSSTDEDVIKKANLDKKLEAIGKNIVQVNGRRTFIEHVFSKGKE